MASSDDEEDAVLQTVTNYSFVDEIESAVSFSVLPIQFDDTEKVKVSNCRVYLHGTADSGLRKVYKQVTAWKLRLEGKQPEISVLSKENFWIKLLKPRKSYEDSIRSILVTIQMLHFLKKKPEASEKILWDYLYKICSTLEVRPSGDDIRGHLSLVKLFMEREEGLEKSQLLHVFLGEKFGRRPAYSEDGRKDLDAKQSFIVDDDVDDDENEENHEDNDDEDESDEESDLFDSVCAICDNGGELLCCEGRCMRSFHAIKDTGVDSHCMSLGYTRAQVKAMQNFLCKNCKHRQHQCFACGKLGSSDKAAGAEVFKCVSATCGHFYHPRCVAGILFRGKELQASEYQKKIEAGESFTCPVHKCYECKQGENKEVPELQFAICRRCPKSYHRKCLPREIAFEDIEEEDFVQRAWDGLLPRRILIYCLKHEINAEIGTPRRDHLAFPDFHDVKESKIKVLEKRKREVSDGLAKDGSSAKPLKMPRKIDSHSLKDSGQPDTQKADEYPTLESNKIPFKDKSKAPGHFVSPPSTLHIPISVFPSVNGEIEKRVSDLIESASCSITLEHIKEKLTVPSTHTNASRQINKAITHGKIEGCVEAIRTALQKIDNSGSIEDVKAVCGPEMVKQIIKWDNKLRVYLAPFLHGMCYTSYGRHFTKLEKLTEIVQKLQWYVQEGDTIVDFCCGSNDFSQLMKDTLDVVGKRCSFRNYDLIPPKNDFSFEMRDWMKVQPKELPAGSQLIMGLNPPFGFKAALANRFIDKALVFKPKLIILIVPKETQRLDEKRKLQYDLVWEDEKILSGKSFYLPGSVDADDKQIDQWNVNPPVLSLWSRADWTAKHKAIALKEGHISAELNAFTEENSIKSMADALSEKQDMDAEKEVRRESSRHAEHTLTGKFTEEKEVRPEGGKNADSSNGRRSPEGDVMRMRGGNDAKNEDKKKFLEKQKTKSRKRRRAKQKDEGSPAKKLDYTSDMSISPHRSGFTNSFEGAHSLELLHTPSERAFNHNAFSGAGMVGSEFVGGRSISVFDNDIHGVTEKYTFNSGRHNLSSGLLGNLDYGVQRSEERLPDYRRDGSSDGYGRNPYIHDYSGYGRPEPDVHSQIRLYGSAKSQDDFIQRSRFSLSRPDSTFSQSGSFPSSTYGLSSSPIGLSAMQRYAPQLEATNYPRQGAFPPGPPHDVHDIPGMRRDMPPNSMSFAPGLRHPYPQQGSSGWLDD